MVLQWLLTGLLVLASGLGILHGAVSLQSYILLGLGVAFAASGLVLMARDHPIAAAA